MCTVFAVQYRAICNCNVQKKSVWLKLTKCCVNLLEIVIFGDFRNIEIFISGSNDEEGNFYLRMVDHNVSIYNNHFRYRTHEITSKGKKSMKFSPNNQILDAILAAVYFKII